MRQDRWQNLLQAALALEAQPSTVEADRQQLLMRLDSLLEVFHSSIDPVDDFEGYATRRLLLTLRGRFTERW